TTNTTILSLFFFFQSYAAHPDLHSFPTRRSSDLQLPARGQDIGLWVATPQRVLGLERADRVHLVGTANGRGRCFREAEDSLRSRDRKSTRLNSSHVAISYAVFCLKKKKRTQRNGT